MPLDHAVLSAKSIDALAVFGKLLTDTEQSIYERRARSIGIDTPQVRGVPECACVCVCVCAPFVCRIVWAMCAAGVGVHVCTVCVYVSRSE